MLFTDIYVGPLVSHFQGWTLEDIIGYIYQKVNIIVKH